jgi:O-antigen biosynthesis protein
MILFGLSFRQVSENLHIDQNRATFTYSDGMKEESHILDMVRAAQNLSSTSWELHEKTETWVERYHFSIHRGAIIRCLSFDRNLRVLEIGAGAGAITRALGEKVSWVDAIEGSVDRARICASRCRDLPNVRVFAADINRIAPEPTYDLVFLIGVLEWSIGFIEGSDPVQKCLQIASAALKPDGNLIVAIENQLGLKYFIGSVEDHCGTPMEGLHGYPNFHQAETFSRVKLSRILKEAGFPKSRFLYPFPDYKLAKVILTDEAVSLCNESIAFWASRYPFDDYLLPAIYKYANQALVTCEVSKAGLLGELGNSFLVIASRQDPIAVQPNWLVWSERLTKNVTLNSTTTLENLDDRLVVRKEYPNLSHQGSDALNRGFKLNSFPDQPFLHGASVELELLRYAVAGNAANFLQTLREWMEFAKQEFALRNPNALADQAWDCIPRNLIRSENGHLDVFDLEFANERPFGLEDLCTRGLLFWFLDHSRWAAKLNPNARTIRDQIVWVVSTLFPNCDAGLTIEATIQRETEFQTWINHLEKEVELFAAIDTPILPYESASSLHAEVIQLRDHNVRLRVFADAVRKTLVYRLYRRIIRPLKGY